MICGIPIDLAFKDNLTCVFDMKTQIIDYYPAAKESIKDTINIVSRIQLKFYVDPLSEFDDISEDNKLLDREQEVIENIKSNPSLLSLTAYNVLHNTFYFNSMQKNFEFKRFLSHIITRFSIEEED